MYKDPYGRKRIGRDWIKRCRVFIKGENDFKEAKMKGTVLFNFLDPIAKVWGDTPVRYHSTSVKKEKDEKARENKDLPKRLPK